MEFGISLSGDNCMLIARRLYLAGDGPRPVRAGSAWPLSSGRSVRRGSEVKRDFACTFTGHLLPVRVVLRSQSCLRLEGRARTLSGPSPDLSPARTLAPPSRCENLLVRRSVLGVRLVCLSPYPQVGVLPVEIYGVRLSVVRDRE
jgi:hypothetical protein